jgi:hypothetical protein
MEFEQKYRFGFIPNTSPPSEPIADRMVILIDLPPDELYTLFGYRA